MGIRLHGLRKELLGVFRRSKKAVVNLVQVVLIPFNVDFVEGRIKRRCQCVLVNVSELVRPETLMHFGFDRLKRVGSNLVNKLGEAADAKLRSA